MASTETASYHSLWRILFKYSVDAISRDSVLRIKKESLWTFIFQTNFDVAKSEDVI